MTILPSLDNDLPSTKKKDPKKSVLEKAIMDMIIPLFLQFCSFFPCFQTFRLQK